MLGAVIKVKQVSGLPKCVTPRELRRIFILALAGPAFISRTLSSVPSMNVVGRALRSRQALALFAQLQGLVSKQHKVYLR